MELSRNGEEVCQNYMVSKHILISGVNACLHHHAATLTMFEEWAGGWR